jgi:hypothetical protein
MPVPHEGNVECLCPRHRTTRVVGRASRPEGLDRSCGRDDGCASQPAPTRSAGDGLALRARTPDPLAGGHRQECLCHTRGTWNACALDTGRLALWVGPPGPKVSTAPAVETMGAHRNPHPHARPGTASRFGRGRPTHSRGGHRQECLCHTRGDRGMPVPHEEEPDMPLPSGTGFRACALSAGPSSEPRAQARSIRGRDPDSMSPTEKRRPGGRRFRGA